jgi:hypothetical protein
MDSINRVVARERIALVVDTSVGSNADAKGIKAHIKSLRESVGDRDPNTKGPEDFKARFQKRQ